jgi:hypothetical protein
VDINTIILIGGLLAQIIAIIKIYFWIVDRMDKKIDERILLNPILQNYRLTQQKVDEVLMPAEKKNTASIQNIKVKLRILNGEKDG